MSSPKIQKQIAVAMTEQEWEHLVMILGDSPFRAVAGHIGKISMAVEQSRTEQKPVATAAA